MPYLKKPRHNFAVGLKHHKGKITYWIDPCNLIELDLTTKPRFWIFRRICPVVGFISNSQRHFFEKWSHPFYIQQREWQTTFDNCFKKFNWRFWYQCQKYFSYCYMSWQKMWVNCFFGDSKQTEWLNECNVDWNAHMFN